MNANLITELKSIWVEEVVVGGQNIGLLSCKRGSPTHAAFAEFGHAAKAQAVFSRFHSTLMRNISTEKNKGVEKVGLSSRHKSMRKSERRDSNMSVASRDSKGKATPRESKFSVHRDSIKDGPDSSKDKLSLFGNRYLEPLSKFARKESSNVHSRSKTDNAKVAEPITVNASILSEVSLLKESFGIDKRNYPPNSLLGWNLGAKYLRPAESSHELSEKLIRLNTKISESRDYTSNRVFLTKSEVERKNIVKQSLSNYGVEKNKITEIINNKLETSLNLLTAEQNQSLTPFDSFGRQYYDRVSRMVIGSPENEFYRPANERQVQDFFNQSTARSKKIFMELVQDGKLDPLMNSIFSHTLDPKDKSSEFKPKKQKRVFKSTDSDDEMREKVKEEVAKTKLSVNKLSEKVVVFGGEIKEFIEDLQTEQNYVKKIIGSVSFSY